MSKNKYQFESKIHVYRATKRMTQQELADLVVVSRQTIMQLERNRYNPSWEFSDHTTQILSELLCSLSHNNSFLLFITQIYLIILNIPGPSHSQGLSSKPFFL